MRLILLLLLAGFTTLAWAPYPAINDRERDFAREQEQFEAARRGEKKPEKKDKPIQQDEREVRRILCVMSMQTGRPGSACEEVARYDSRPAAKRQPPPRTQ